MSQVLLATCTRFPDGDEDAALLLDALARLGVEARFVAWDDPATDWSSGVVVLRSTWDYTTRRAEFLAWTRSVPRLLNSADVVEWSSDKVYLRDLGAAGIPIVPTVVVEPGDDAGWDWPDADEIVVKPSVGAGSRSVGRFAREREQQAREHATGLRAGGYTALVQPYQSAVDEAGETALVYVDGVYSHAIRKAPMLPPAVVHAFGSDELFKPESIAPRTPGPDERAVGDAVVEAVRARFGADQLYARVDLLPSLAGPVVVELELVEPSMFLGDAPSASDAGGAADRFAAAIAART